MRENNLAFIIIPILLVLFSCGSRLMYSQSHLKAAIRIKNITPENCEQALYQVDTLEMGISYLWHQSFSLNLDYSELMARISPLDEAIEEKLKQAVKIDSQCVNAYARLGDRAAQKMFYEDSLIQIAKYWYHEGYNKTNGNCELSTRMGYMMEVLDSIELAMSYFNKASACSSEFIDLEKAKERLAVLNNFKEIFKSAEDEAYILFERIPTYSMGQGIKAYYKITGSGQFEWYDYEENSDKAVLKTCVLDSTDMDYVLGMLEKSKFLLLHNPFNRAKGSIDFDYVNQWHLPIYTISMHLPSIEHSLHVYGLCAIYGPNATRDILSITYIPDLNVPPDSKVMNRIDLLSSLWERVYGFAEKYKL